MSERIKIIGGNSLFSKYDYDIKCDIVQVEAIVRIIYCNQSARELVEKNVQIRLRIKKSSFPSSLPFHIIGINQLMSAQLAFNLFSENPVTDRRKK